MERPIVTLAARPPGTARDIPSDMFCVWPVSSRSDTSPASDPSHSGWETAEVLNVLFFLPFEVFVDVSARAAGVLRDDVFETCSVGSSTWLGALGTGGMEFPVQRKIWHGEKHVRTLSCQIGASGSWAFPLD